LLEVIEQSGMADAIARMPNGIKGNKNAVAETIANNVRKKIIKEALYRVLDYDESELERIFPIIVAQTGFQKPTPVQPLMAVGQWARAEGGGNHWA
jgi:hypothetical protein